MDDRFWLVRVQGAPIDGFPPHPVVEAHASQGAACKRAREARRLGCEVVLLGQFRKVVGRG